MTPTKRELARIGARYELARRYFVDFLGFCQIEDAHRGVIPYERWPHLLDLASAWQAGESQVVLKARQLGVSWLVAAFVLWRAMNQRASTILEISKGQRDSEELLGKSRAIWRHLPDALRVPLETDNGGEMQFRGAGRIIALPSTENAGRSFTGTVVVVDVAAFHPWASTNYAAYRPTLDGGGQFLMVSTANGTTGLFHDLWTAANAGQNGYTAVFIPWWARPTRQDENGQPSQAWLERERAAFVGLPAEFRAEYPATAGEAFVAQTGLVFGMDDDGVLIFNPEQHPRGNLAPDPCAWQACKWHYGYVDWGGGDPTAAGLIGVRSSDRIHQFTEFHRTGPVTVEEIGRFFIDNAPIPDGYDYGYDSIECGADEPVAIATLASMGLPARAADTRRKEGLGALAMVLKSRRFTLNPETCPRSVAEFDSYRWAERRDTSTREMYATSTPFDHHGDHKDGERYAVMAILADEMARRDSDDAYVGVRL